MTRRVSTFEVDEGITLLGGDDSLGQASARLPQGTYTTFRTYGGDRVLRLDDHHRRLTESAAQLGRSSPLAPARLRRAVALALQATGHAESRLRVTFAPPRLFVSVEPFAPLPEALYRDGVACATVPVQRRQPRAKDTRFIATAADAQAHLPAGVHEGLLVAEDGAVLEGLSSNFFAIQDSVLYTEEARALAGVTRSLVLDLARDVVPIRLVAPSCDGLAAAGEAFLSSASRGILPVVKVDGRPIGDGRPGPITLRLAGRLDERIAAEAESVLD